MEVDGGAGICFVIELEKRQTSERTIYLLPERWVKLIRYLYGVPRDAELSR